MFDLCVRFKAVANLKTVNALETCCIGKSSPAVSVLMAAFSQDKFLEKNNDALHASLEGLIHESRNGFLQGLFAAGQAATNGSVAGHSGVSDGSVAGHSGITKGSVIGQSGVGSEPVIGHSGVNNGSVTGQHRRRISDDTDSCSADS